MHRSGSGASWFLIPGRLTTLRALDRSIELVLIGLCGIFVVWPILAFILHPVMNPQAKRARQAPLVYPGAPARSFGTTCSIARDH